MNVSGFNVEDEFAAAISSIGGKRVTSLIGHAPTRENADFAFPEQAVVAELKCLDEDKMFDERIIQKASNIYLAEVQRGQAPVVAFGEVELSTAGFSADYTRQIANFYRVPIERQIRKADRQIAVTVGDLGQPDARGLLLVANNNHTALDPWHAQYILSEILGQSLYPNINAAVFFAGNLGSVAPGSSERIDYWIEVRRPSRPPIDSAFLAAVRAAWYRRLTELFGADNQIVRVDMQALLRLESR